MGKINFGRLILGGVVAGLVADVLDWFVDGVWLAPRWADGLQSLNHPGMLSLRQIVGFDLLGIAAGIAAIWIYAGIRPRFGAGARTAVYAGVVTWILTCLLPNVGFMYVTGLFGNRLTLYTTLGGLVEIVVGTIVGAALYRETQSSSARPQVAEAPKQSARA